MPEATDEYKLPITVMSLGYDYDVLLNSINAKKVASFKFNIKNIKDEAYISIATDPYSNSIEWEIMIGNGGTKTCIRHKHQGWSFYELNFLVFN